MTLMYFYLSVLCISILPETEGIHNLDFSRVFIGESHLFVNSDHLNVLGSEEFISLLCNEL